MTGRPQALIQWLFEQDRDKLFDIKEHREKRSLNANAYCWALIGKIADALRISKDVVYLDALRQFGQSEFVSVLSDINVTGYFKYYEVVGTGHVEGKEFTHYKVFKGSSEYDAREMSILIDGIVGIASDLEIETLPPAEIERLKSKWQSR